MDKERLEFLAGSVMIPLLIWDNYWNRTSNSKRLAGITMQEYDAKIDEFAFGEKRGYDGFRRFLRKHSNIFGERYNLLRNLTDEEINYIFTRVGEERIKSSVFH